MKGYKKLKKYDPNHIHAIVILYAETHGRASERGRDECGRNSNNAHTADMHGHTAETHGRASVTYRRPKSISSFVAGFKSAVVSGIDDYIDEQQLDIPKYNRNHKFWQRNYHDHIIRNKGGFYCITQYIIENPMKWAQDKSQNEYLQDLN